MPRKKETLTPAQANFVLSGQIATLERIKKTFKGYRILLTQIDMAQQDLRTLKKMIQKGESL